MPVRTSVIAGWLLICVGVILFFEWIALPFGALAHREYQLLIGLELLVTSAVIVGILVNPKALAIVLRPNELTGRGQRSLGFIAIVCSIVGGVMMVTGWS